MPLAQCRRASSFAHSSSSAVVLTHPQMLNGTSLAPEFNMDALAQLTDGFSGSDLKELCRDAVMVPVREFLKASGGDHALLSRTEAEVRFILLQRKRSR